MMLICFEGFSLNGVGNVLEVCCLPVACTSSCYQLAVAISSFIKLKNLPVDKMARKMLIH